MSLGLREQVRLLWLISLTEGGEYGMVYGDKQAKLSAHSIFNDAVLYESSDNFSSFFYQEKENKGWTVNFFKVPQQLELQQQQERQRYNRTRRW